MRILIAYVSPNGTTAAVAKELARGFEARGMDARLIDIGRLGWRPDEPGFQEKARDILRGIDALCIGGPVYHLRFLAPVGRFLEAALSVSDTSMRVFAFATYGGISSGAALRNAARIARRHGAGFSGALKINAPHFFKRAPFPDEAAMDSISGFDSALAQSGFSAASAAQTESALALRGKKRLAYMLAPIMGRFRRLDIRIDASACTGCGRCGKECPAGALRAGRPPERNARTCLYCYHCAIACPAGAILCRVERIQEFVRVNEGILGREEPRNAFFVPGAQAAGSTLKLDKSKPPA